jgi:MFS family permease
VTAHATPRFPALAHREFRRYFAGQAIALVGGFAHNVAMAWLAYRLTGSVALLGVVGFAQLAPAMLVSPVAGLFADRYPRRRMLIALLSTVAALGLLLAALTWTGLVTPAVLVAIAALRGLMFACEIPIRHAFLGDLVTDRAALPNAVALHSSALNTARFVGPALGGLLIGALGEAACFLLHPLTLCATLWQLSRIRTDESHAGRAATGSFGRQYLDGWRFAFAEPTIARLLVGVFLLGFGVGPYVHLMPAAVADLHGAHPEWVGMFVSCAGLGAMIAAMSLAARRGRDDLPRIAIAGNVIAALGLAAFAQSRWMPLSAAGMVAVGLGTIAQAVSTNMAIQLRVPDGKRGRVLAIYTAMFIGATPLGSLFFGWVGEALGAANALLAGAALAAAGAALTAWRARSGPG